MFFRVGLIPLRDGIACLGLCGDDLVVPRVEHPGGGMHGVGAAPPQFRLFGEFGVERVGGLAAPIRDVDLTQRVTGLVDGITHLHELLDDTGDRRRLATHQFLRVLGRTEFAFVDLTTGRVDPTIAEVVEILADTIRTDPTRRRRRLVEAGVDELSGLLGGRFDPVLDCVAYVIEDPHN
ncbi:hypothetical protein GCM10023318_50060 [Nocardia callitridis]|uniref:Uncharacterized protein n=1 Tax=Nocardia callitridis TaxID=648753 RepID=A0ABP9KUT7_9NOCA